MGGKKNDFLDKKLRWDLLPLQEIEDIVRVYTAGANKYGDNNWQHLDNGYQRYKAAMLRHLLEYEKGNVYDDETGCRHLAQVAWNAIAMLYLSKKDKTLEALDKRISEKIDECNSILDEFHNHAYANHLEKLKQIQCYEHNKGESGTGDDDLSAEDC